MPVEPMATNAVWSLAGGPHEHLRGALADRQPLDLPRHGVALERLAHELGGAPQHVALGRGLHGDDRHREAGAAVERAVVADEAAAGLEATGAAVLGHDEAEAARDRTRAAARPSILPSQRRHDRRQSGRLRSAAMAVVNHVGLCVTDLDRSRRFYEAVLGFAWERDLHGARRADVAAAPGARARRLAEAVLPRAWRFVLESWHFDRDGNDPRPRARRSRSPASPTSPSPWTTSPVRTLVTEHGGEVLTDTDLGGLAIMVATPTASSSSSSP